MIQDSLWKLLGVIICVIMLFIIPLLSVYERQDEITYNIVMNEANNFSQRIRSCGYIDMDMIHQFYGSINALGQSFEVEFEHLSKRFSNNEGLLDVYYDGSYTSDIFEYLESNHRYDLSIGDFFYIRVKNKSKSKSQTIREFVGVSSKANNYLYIVSGGIVRYGNT